MARSTLDLDFSKSTVFDIPTGARLTLPEASLLINNTPNLHGEHDYRWKSLFKIGLDHEEVAITALKLYQNEGKRWSKGVDSAYNEMTAAVTFRDADLKSFNTATFEFLVDSATARKVFAELLRRHGEEPEEVDEADEADEEEVGF